MITLLSDIGDLNAANSKDFFIVVIGGLAVLGIFIAILKCVSLIKDVFGRKPPLDDHLAAQESRLAKLEQLIPTLATKEGLDFKFAALDAKRSHDSGELHKHVEKINHDLGTRITDSISSINDSIHDMPVRIIAILKDTGAIGKDRH